MRGRNFFTNKSISRNISMFSTKSSVMYYERIVFNNLNNNDKLMDLTPDLSYETEQERVLCFNKMAEQQKYMRTNNENNETTTVHSTKDKGVINIQLQYNL